MKDNTRHKINILMVAIVFAGSAFLTFTFLLWLQTELISFFN